MKNHVWRPLFVVLALVALILLVRLFIVPDDFGVNDQGYMYGYHRFGNEQEWKEFPVKYRTMDYCVDCHDTISASRSESPHGAIQCENCHGPAREHPDKPEKLAIDTSRDLCLRCHSYLPYAGSDRGDLIGILPDEHNPGENCVLCHNPHRPNLEEM